MNLRRRSAPALPLLVSSFSAFASCAALASFAALAGGCGSGGAKPAPAAPASTSSSVNAAGTGGAPVASASTTETPAASASSAPGKEPATASKVDAAKIADTTLALGDDLLGRLDDKGNVVFAPASVAAALAMTYGGARGTTATEMAKTLHLDGLEQAKVHAAWSALLASWNATSATSAKGPKEPQVEIANRLFGQQGHSFLPAFLALTKDSYGAALEPVDYVGAAEKARVKINQWVSERTAKAIPELVAKGVLDKDTRLTLVNAIHLKGAWVEPFHPAATQPAKFHAPGGDVDVPTMNGLRHARFAESKDAQIIALPFASAGAYDLELDVVLPTLPTAPAKGAAEAKPSLRAWSAAIDAAESTMVTLSLPRFKVNGSFGLAPTLAAMGMPSAFTRAADFSGIDGTKELLLSAVVHQAVLDVYESGAEASAATAVAMGIKGLARPALVMRVDRPFYVMIRDHKTGAVLFVAHVRNPKA